MQNPDEDMLMSLTAQLSQQVSDGANTNTIEHNSITFEYKVNLKNRWILRFFQKFFDFLKNIFYFPKTWNWILTHFWSLFQMLMTLSDVQFVCQITKRVKRCDVWFVYISSISCVLINGFISIKNVQSVELILNQNLIWTSKKSKFHRECIYIWWTRCLFFETGSFNLKVFKTGRSVSETGSLSFKPEAQLSRPESKIQLIFQFTAIAMLWRKFIPKQHFATIMSS